MVDLIGEDYEASGLSQRYKTIVALIDVVMGDPTSDLTPELKAQLKDEFSPAELEELVLMAGVACGFSNLAIAWGAAQKYAHN